MDTTTLADEVNGKNSGFPSEQSFSPSIVPKTSVGLSILQVDPVNFGSIVDCNVRFFNNLFPYIIGKAEFGWTQITCDTLNSRFP